MTLEGYKESKKHMQQSTSGVLLRPVLALMIALLFTYKCLLLDNLD